MKYLILALCAASFAGGLNIGHAPIEVTRTVYVESASRKPLGMPVMRHADDPKFYGRQADTLAAVIPASALKPFVKHR